MKRLLTASVLSIAALALVAGRAPAWCHLFHHCDKCCQFSICCRPYNAFSPVCFGNMSCVGCCPGGGGNAGPSCGCAGSGAGWDGGFLGQLPAGEPMVHPGPGMTTVPFQAPMPTPAAPGAAPMGYYGAMMPGWPMVQPAAYGPGYLPPTMGYGYPGMNGGR